MSGSSRAHGGPRDLDTVAVNVGDLVINAHDDEDGPRRSPFRLPFKLTRRELRLNERRRGLPFFLKYLGLERSASDSESEDGEQESGNVFHEGRAALSVVLTGDFTSDSLRRANASLPKREF